MDNGNSTVARTPTPGCVACARRWRHELPVLREFHPLTGHGYTKEGGWSHPDLQEQK